MPKEMIHCRDFGRTVLLETLDGEKEIGTLDTDALKVGWSKEVGHVELAVCQMVEGSFVEHGFLDGPQEETDCDKRVRLALLTPRYIQMDREGLNRLIRTLRQARDDAFGRDE